MTHEYNDIRDKDDLNSYEKEKKIERIRKQQEEAKKEFNDLIKKHAAKKHKDSFEKKNGKYKEIPDNLSHDTLSDSDFDPIGRDQVRNDIQKLLQNNFRVNKNRKKKRGN